MAYSNLELIYVWVVVNFPRQDTSPIIYLFILWTFKILDPLNIVYFRRFRRKNFFLKFLIFLLFLAYRKLSTPLSSDITLSHLHFAQIWPKFGFFWRKYGIKMHFLGFLPHVYGYRSDTGKFRPGTLMALFCLLLGKRY